MMSLPPLAPALHKALLAGTSRMPLKPDESGACAEIGEMLQAAKLATGSEANPMLLWHAMAANELWQRAGFTPASGAASVSPATSDSRICPMAAEHILSLILRGIHPELLETWLARAHTAQARLPHQFLVALLQDGMHKPLLRALIMPLLGTRGHWLVAQHPEWSRRYGSIEQDDIKAQWQHGNPIDRGQALRVLRQRNPQQARALLEADWASEAPENRAQLLACLAVGLSLDDEALLEQALDDKRKEVRSAAVTLLRSLNGSQLMQRCQQRLTALCNSERQFSLPDSCDKAMKRDGVGAQKMTGLGEKAGWLLDLMRSVAPGHWCRAWQSTPTQVLAVLASQEFNGALETGMAHAACAALQACASQENAEWYALVLSYLGRGWPKFDYAMMPELMQSFTLLPAAQQRILEEIMMVVI